MGQGPRQGDQRARTHSGLGNEGISGSAGVVTAASRAFAVVMAKAEILDHVARTRESTLLITNTDRCAAGVLRTYERTRRVRFLLCAVVSGSGVAVPVVMSI